MCFYESPFDTVHQRGDSVALAVISGIVHIPDSTLLVLLAVLHFIAVSVAVFLLFLLHVYFLLFSYNVHDFDHFALLMNTVSVNAFCLTV